MRLRNIKLEKVVILTGREAVKISIISIIVAFIIFSIFLLSQGANPIDAYIQIFSFAFDPKLGLPSTLHRGIFLLFVTLAFILPLKAGIWNIGMEGQFYLGTIGAFAAAYAWSDLPSNMLIPLVLIVSGFFGAFYGTIVGFLKGKYGVNEIVIALMLNNIGYWLIYLLVVGGPWMGVAESNSKPMPTSAVAPMIWDTPFTIFLALAISVILYFVIKKTNIGFQLRVLGSSLPAAEHAGISPLKISIFVMAVGGAIAGIAGYHMWGGDPAFYKIPGPNAYKPIGDFTYWGIMVGLICILNPIAAIPASIFVGGIKQGGTILIRRLKLPVGLDLAFLGILFLTFVAFQFFYHYKITRVKKRG
ncbi:MAG: ABC transporter permease [Candidatus Hadarchaeum sp.]|uniref:ABC transporter permease n=1 Tax=Candidatus Hadarchaeum sp. TaxID=2883567 RepID=UPI00316E6813